MDSKISSIIITASLLLSSCVTTVQKRFSFKPQEEVAPFCSDKVASQKYVFLLHSDLSPKMGVKISNAENDLEERFRKSEWVADNFIKLLLTEYLSNDQPIGNSMVEKSGGSTANEESNVWIAKTPLWEFQQTFNKTGKRLAWIGKNEFYLWDADVLSEEPNTTLGTKIELECRSSLFFGHYLTTFTRGCPISSSGLFSFAGQTGFNATEFIDNHYFTASDADKSKLCEKAGLQADCFDFSTDEKIHSMRNALEKGAARQRYPFLTYSKFTGSSYDDLRNKDHVRLDWQSALIKDLILQGSVKISKKINGNVTDYRIEWDPMPFCKYRRPKSDLYTH